MASHIEKVDAPLSLLRALSRAKPSLRLAPIFIVIAGLLSAQASVSASASTIGTAPRHPRQTLVLQVASRGTVSLAPVGGARTGGSIGSYRGGTSPKISSGTSSFHSVPHVGTAPHPPKTISPTLKNHSITSVSPSFSERSALHAGIGHNGRHRHKDAYAAGKSARAKAASDWSAKQRERRRLEALSGTQFQPGRENCYWLRRQAMAINSRYWWQRYYACTD